MRVEVKDGKRVVTATLPALAKKQAAANPCPAAKEPVGTDSLLLCCGVATGSICSPSVTITPARLGWRDSCSSVVPGSRGFSPALGHYGLC